MFKIKGFYLFCAWAWLVCFEPVMAQKAPKPSCYAAEEQVVDSTIPCCAGLQPMHEVGTRKVFCDQPPSSKGAVYMWSIILFFPLLLLVFAIFGIRNKMAQRKNNSNA